MAGLLWRREHRQDPRIALPLGLSLSAVGAPLTGLVKDSTGSFILPWIVACFGLAICTLFAVGNAETGAPGRRRGRCQAGGLDSEAVGD